MVGEGAGSGTASTGQLQEMGLAPVVATGERPAINRAAPFI
jgi:hypothetical protein